MKIDSFKHSFYFGKKRIEFDLIQSNRKTLGITVKPDSSVYVRSPQNKSIDDVLSKVKHKAPWILKQIDQFDSNTSKSSGFEKISSNIDVCTLKSRRR